MQKHRLLSPSDIRPIREDLECIGAFNPGAAILDDRLALLVRVAVRPKEHRQGFLSTVECWDGDMKIDWLASGDYDTRDHRIHVHRGDGRVCLSSMSYLQTYWITNFKEPISEWHWEAGDVVMPSSLYETYGIEDARCTWIEGCCYVTYTSVSAHGACPSLMTTTDFKTFMRHGVILPCENKDVVLFPERIDGDLHCLHRPVSATKFCQPEMWTAASDDAVRWGNHHVLASGEGENEDDRIGAGTPPAKHGQRYWAMYHASQKSDPANAVGRYVGAMMEFVIFDGRVQLQRRSRQPLLTPTESWEVEGFVPNVVFPMAMLATREQWLVVYGAADTHVAVASFSSNEIEASFA